MAANEAGESLQGMNGPGAGVNSRCHQPAAATAAGDHWPANIPDEIWPLVEPLLSHADIKNIAALKPMAGLFEERLRQMTAELSALVLDVKGMLDITAPSDTMAHLEEVVRQRYAFFKTRGYWWHAQDMHKNGRFFHLVVYKKAMTNKVPQIEIELLGGKDNWRFGDPYMQIQYWPYERPRYKLYELHGWPPSWTRLVIDLLGCHYTSDSNSGFDSD